MEYQTFSWNKFAVLKSIHNWKNKSFFTASKITSKSSFQMDMRKVSKLQILSIGISINYRHKGWYVGVKYCSSLLCRHTRPTGAKHKINYTTKRYLPSLRSLAFQFRRLMAHRTENKDLWDMTSTVRSTAFEV